jgi:hypothetical protein
MEYFSCVAAFSKLFGFKEAEQTLQRTRAVAPQQPFAAELWVRLLKASNIIKMK